MPAAPRIVLVGTGRLGRAIALTFPDRIVAVAGRSFESARRLADTIGTHVESSAMHLPAQSFDLLWLATSDGALAEVSTRLAAERERWEGIVVVHSSGATGTSVLEAFRRRGARVAVLHPNASITGEEPLPRGLHWSVTSDAEGPGFDEIGSIIGSLHPTLVAIDDRLRPLYHAAASVAANFPVTLFDMAVELFTRSGVSNEDARAIVAMYMRTIIERLAIVEPSRALTGPIARGDVDVVKAQLDAIARSAPELSDAFLALARLTATRFSNEELWRELG